MTNRPTDHNPSESEEAAQIDDTAISYSSTPEGEQSAHSPSCEPPPFSNEIDQSLMTTGSTDELSASSDLPIVAEGQGFDEQWAAIVEDLSDIQMENIFHPSRTDLNPSVIEDLSPGEEHDDTPVFSRFHTGAGPRDWVAPEDEEMSEELADDINAAVTFTSFSEPEPHHRLAVPCWISAALLIGYAVFAAFGALPGGHLTSFFTATVGFSLAALAGFLSSPRAEDTDPFDDGARL